MGTGCLMARASSSGGRLLGQGVGGEAEDQVWRTAKQGAGCCETLNFDPCFYVKPCNTPQLLCNSPFGKLCVHAATFCGCVIPR